MILASLAGPLRNAARSLCAMLASPQAAVGAGEFLFRILGRRPRRGDQRLAAVRGVLILRLDDIGDVVLTTPLLRELRRNAPESWITLIVKPAVYNLVERCPHVNEVLTYDCNTRPRLRDLRRHGRALRLAWQHLWPRRFDLAIHPRWDVDATHGAFLAYFSGARWRVGYSEHVVERKQRANAGYDRLLTHPLDDRRPAHEVSRNLEILRFVGGHVEDECLELWLSAEDERFATETLRAHGVGADSRLIALSPGAGNSRRMWPLAGFLALGAWLGQELHARILVIGGRGEEPLGQEMQRHLGPTGIDLVGRTTLRQAGALLKRCHLFVGNDAGPMHMAAAAGVPVVVISCHPQEGPPAHENSPRRFGPWGVAHGVVQPETALDPCVGACSAPQAHCITQIGIGQVKAAVGALLGQPPGNPARTVSVGLVSRQEHPSNR